MTKLSQDFDFPDHVDAVVASSIEHVCLLTGHMTWLGERMRDWMGRPGGTCSFQAGYAVITRSGQVGLVASNVVQADARACQVDEVCLFGRSAPYADADAALIALLDALGVLAGRVAFECDGFDAARLAGVREALPSGRTMDASLWLRSLRMVKSEDALAAMRHAAAATEAAMAHVFAGFLAGVDLVSLRIGFRHELAEWDCDYDHLVYGAQGGGVTDAIAPAEPVHALFFDAGARYRGYFSDTGITLTRGAWSATDAERFGAAHSAVDAGAKALLAGRPASDAWAAMQAEAARVPGLVAQGHGLGLGIREWPYFGAASDAVLQDDLGKYRIDAILAADMVVNLEVGGHFTDGSSIQIEKSFVVSPHGTPTPLVALPRDTPVLLAGLPMTSFERKAFA